MSVAEEIGVDDLYQFLGVDSSSTEKEITTGYRKKALKYHPDKNPDDPTASDLFQKLSKAYLVLTDPVAKAAYDKWLKAKYAAQRRHAELDARRKKLKESLEVRERQGDEELAAKKLEKEINRLREDTMRKIKEQEELLRQEEEQHQQEDDDTMPTLKLKWTAKKGDATNGGYSEEVLERLFSKFGVHHILISKKRNGKALMSFHHEIDAIQAMHSGIGLKENPLHMTMVSGTASGTGTQSGLHFMHMNPDFERDTLQRLREAQRKKDLQKEQELQNESDSLQRTTNSCTPKPHS